MGAPVLFGLLRVSPPREDLRLHLGTAAVLALALSQILALIFAIPRAEPGPGRFRVLPSSPHRPMLVASIGASSLCWCLLQLVEHPDLLALAGALSGALALWVADRWRRDPLWGTWFEVSNEVLRVHVPGGEGWSVPLSRAIAVHRRARDGSFLLETPWPERNLFVPTPKAHARYVVSDHAALLAELLRVVPLVEATRAGRAPPPGQGAHARGA